MIKIISIAMLVFFYAQSALGAGIGSSYIRAKSVAEADIISNEMASAMSAGSIKFGPAHPAEELGQRKNSFRLEYIAAGSLRHNSSSGIDMTDCLSRVAVAVEIINLSEIIEIDLGLILLEIENARYYWRKIGKEACRQWFDIEYRNDYSRKESLSGLIGRLLSALNRLDSYFISGLWVESIDACIDVIMEPQKKEEALEILSEIRKDITLMREFCYDRQVLLMHGNVKGAIASFSNIEDRIADGREGRLVIDKNGLIPGTTVAMSSARLFSLINNLAANALRYIKDDGFVRLRIYTDKTSDELVISVVDNGIGMPVEYFKKQENGLIRFFDLEERNDRVPIGLAEVWDITAISNGTILVETEPGKSTAITVRLPAAITASAIGCPSVFFIETPTSISVSASAIFEQSL